MGRLKSGLMGKVVRLPGWSHSKVPLYSQSRRHWDQKGYSSI